MSAFFRVWYLAVAFLVVEHVYCHNWLTGAIFHCVVMVYHAVRMGGLVKGKLLKGIVF